MIEHQEEKTPGTQDQVDEIAKEVAPGNPAVVVFDRAVWHTMKKLRLPGNIS